jgi:hypothetical protein
LQPVALSYDHDIRRDLPHFDEIRRKHLTICHHAARPVQCHVRPVHGVTSLPTRANDIDPFNVGRQVGDESIHIVPIPSLPPLNK